MFNKNSQSSLIKNKPKTKFLFVFYVVVSFLFSFYAIYSFYNVSVSANSYELTRNSICYSKEYLEYLSLTEEEKNTFGAIPRMYDIDVSSLYTSSSYQNLLNSNDSLPEEFSLYYTKKISDYFNSENRTTNIVNLPKNVGNQKGTGLCWTFATLTALESTLYNLGIAELDANLNFSELNLAYVTQVVNHGCSTIGGGTFDLAYEYLSYEFGPVDEQENESSCFGYTNADYQAQVSYVNNFLNSANKSGYSVLESFSYPARKSCTTNQEKIDLRNSIKNHIKTYGAVTASISTDSQGSHFISTNPTVFYNPNSGDLPNHLITLVGWDDNFSITYGSSTLTGAYIAQNSWGENWGNSGYFYIMYNDYCVENCVNGFVRVGEDIDNYVLYSNLSGTNSENTYLTITPTVTYCTQVSNADNYIVSNIFKKENIANQYISRIKIPTVASRTMKFNVYVLDGLTENDISSSNKIQNYLSNNFASANKIKNKNASGSDKYLFNAQQTGLYTIDLDEQLSVDGDYFIVFCKIISGSCYATENISNNDSISVDQFTYLSTNNGSSWSYYNSQKTVLPIMVETEYVLNTIEYLKCDVEKTYDGVCASWNINITNLQTNEYLIYYSLDETNYDSNILIKNAGTYKIYFRIKADFYEQVEDSFNVTILPRKLTVTPNSNQSKIYGELDAISYKVDNKVSGETPKFAGRLGRESGEDVGEYKITCDFDTFSLIDNGVFKASNYTFEFVENVKYFITPKTLTIIPDKLSKIYGQDDPLFTFTYSGILDNEVACFSGKLNRETNNNVGIYDIKLDDNNPLTLVNSGSFKATNYVLDLIEDNNAFEIKKKEIIVTPTSNLKKLFGEQDPVFTYTWSGEAYNETAKFVGKLTRVGQDEEIEAVGSYEIIYYEADFYLVDNGSFKVSNYYFTLTPSIMFVINYGVLTNCTFESKEFNYDGQQHNLIGENKVIANVNVLYSIDNLNWSEEVVNYKDCGAYTIYAKFVCENYDEIILFNTLTIKKIDLKVSPNKNQTKVYDGNAKVELTYNYSGNVVGETPNFDGKLDIGTNCNVGAYLINVGTLGFKDSATFKASNYNFVYDNLENTCFEIKKRTVTIKPNQNQFKTYSLQDGTLNYTILNLVDGEEPNVSGTLQRESGENVGNYLILQGNLNLSNSQTFGLSNYNVEFTNENIYYQIKKSSITITLQNVSCYYGANPIFSYFISSGNYKVEDNFNVEYICAVTPNTKKDDRNVDYTIYATAQNDNYDITIQTAIYTVLYKTFEVHFKILNEIITLYDEIEQFNFVDALLIPPTAIDGYEFEGWAIFTDNRTSYKIVNPATYEITRETTFEALMREKEYTIKFNTISENQLSYTKKYTISSADLYFDTPFREGYTFIAWYDNEELSGESVSYLLQGNTGDKDYYAKWKINTYKVKLPTIDTEKYSILYQGSNLVDYKNSFSFKVQLDSAYSKSNILVSYNTLENTNKTYLYKDLNTNLYTINEVKSNINLFVENLSVNTYKVEFVIDSKVKSTLSKSYGETLLSEEYPLIPVKENYDNTAPTWDIYGISSVEDDYVVTAQYTPNVYNVTFILNDGNSFTTQVTYGEEVKDDVLQNAYDLNMFEYFDYDANLFGIDKDTIINVEIKSNIYILYIVLGGLGTIIVLSIIIVLLKKKAKNKLAWWAYVKNPQDKIKK